ncbi:MAG: hypothetical protein JWN53_1423 [Gemmatimonadetes bacterium]|jgi:hypothetical protein|nr:hypothetical protein [Gemmatimonadota bacterium]
MRRILRPATFAAVLALVALSACASPTAPSASTRKKVATSVADDVPPGDGYVIPNGK